MCCLARISLDGFVNLTVLSVEVDGSDWPGVADTLRPLRARLETLIMDVFYAEMVTDSDRLVKEDGEAKAMRTNGLEFLDPLLSRDNFKDLSLLTFALWGYRDTLPSLQDRTLHAIQRKLPTLHSRATLQINLELLLLDRPPPPSTA